MKTLAMVLASGLMFASFSIGAASAAPGLTQAERMRASSSIGYAGNYKARKYHMRHHGHRHDAIHHSRANRTHHTRNRLMHGDPNARNPMLPGYAQQRGNTSGGPRY
jgi:hypothetical protein